MENDLKFYKLHNSYVEDGYSIKTIGIFKNNIPQNVYYSYKNNSITLKKNSFLYSPASLSDNLCIAIVFLPLIILFLVIYIKILKYRILNFKLFKLYKYLKHYGSYYKDVKFVELENHNGKENIRTDFVLENGKNVSLIGFCNNVSHVCDVLIDENNPKKYVIQGYFEKLKNIE